MHAPAASLMHAPAVSLMHEPALRALLATDTYDYQRCLKQLYTQHPACFTCALHLTIATYKLLHSTLYVACMSRSPLTDRYACVTRSIGGPAPLSSGPLTPFRTTNPIKQLAHIHRTNVCALQETWCDNSDPTYAGVLDHTGYKPLGSPGYLTRTRIGGGRGIIVKQSRSHATHQLT